MSRAMRRIGERPRWGRSRLPFRKLGRAKRTLAGSEGIDFHRPQQNVYRPDMSSRSRCEALLAPPYFPQRLLDF